MASTPLDPTNLHQNPEDRQIEKALRPKAIGEFGGQQKIVDNLSVFIGAAKMRNEIAYKGVWASGVVRWIR